MSTEGYLARAVLAAVVVASGYGALLPSAADDAAVPTPGLVAGHTPRADVPLSTSVVIGPDGSRRGYATPVVTMSQDGLLSAVNLDTIDHTVTSVAVGTDGEPLFDVRVPSGATVSIPSATGLAAGTYDFYCFFHPSMRGELVVQGSSGGTPPAPPTFEQPLAVPDVVRDDRVRLTARAAKVQMLPSGPKTPLWTFGGTYPGPTIRRPAGRHTELTVTNDLPRRSGAVTVHLHGDHHASKDDGLPTRYLIHKGEQRTYDYPLTYDGRAEPSSFFFYHDHRMDRTSRNNWRGLQGMFIVDDAKDAGLRLPRGRHDLPLLVADRSFTRRNRLTNPFSDDAEHTSHHGQMAWVGPQAPPNDATVGSRILVNGRVAPYHRVSATRYRLRLLNGSNFSAYNFSLSDGRPFVQVGTGMGLLPRPVVRQNVLLGPAQRADVVVDFQGEPGQDVVLSSVPRTDEGTGSRSAPIMEFRVRGTAKDPTRIPARLGPVPRLDAPERVSQTWEFGLGGDADTGSFWSINGKSFEADRVDHEVPLGSTQTWRLRNTSEMTHYVHIHAEQWHTVTRDGKRPPPEERGLEDTWRLDPGEVIEVAARFADYTGPFMIHCHMLDHEDHGMMATFAVIDPRARGTTSRPAEAPAAPAPGGAHGPVAASGP
ncbi:MAG: multicopper oxidase domain-containing protein [Nocardioides sp.]